MLHLIYIVLIKVDDYKVVFVDGFDCIRKCLVDFFVGKLAAWIYNDIKDDVGVSRTGNYTQVVDVGYAVQAVCYFCCYFVHQGYYRIIDFDWIHVGSKYDVKFFRKLTLNIIYHIMAFHQIAVCIYLNVNGGENFTWTIIVNR